MVALQAHNDAVEVLVEDISPLSHYKQLAVATAVLAALHVPQATVEADPHDVQTPYGRAVVPAAKNDPEGQKIGGKTAKIPVLVETQTPVVAV